MWQYIMPAAATIVVAIIEAIAAADRKKNRKSKEETARHEQECQEIMVLMLQSVNASIALGEACAHAMQRGHTNGDMEQALDYAQDIKHRQKDYLVEHGVHDVMS